MEQLIDAWQWYIGLFSDPSIGVRIAAWTATLATLTFLLNFILKPLWKSAKSRSATVKVELGMNHILISAPFVGSGLASPELTCTVTNKGDKAVHIKKPVIEASRQLNGHKTFMVVGVTPVQYPFKLEHGQQHQFTCDAAALSTHVLQHMKDSDTVRFLVKTTTDKQYRSNSFTKKHIVGHVEMARRKRRL